MCIYMSMALISIRVEKEVLDELRKERVNISEVARQALLARYSEAKLNEFKEKMAQASISAKKLSKVSKTLREFRESR